MTGLLHGLLALLVLTCRALTPRFQKTDGSPRLMPGGGSYEQRRAAANN